ncbi:MAG TPA: UDP-3-O-(3-hydroxymyristoyl)glucosamine N-acyltransferase [Steroidobacteraceae bacterium]|nr:UDP-3-O-(3-hydroxymyristoyl)glucosamine N-acyltransferase [Steroidobacteraceae bacterium]
MLNAHVIKQHHSDLFTYLQGDLQSSASECRSPEDAAAGTLIYVGKPEQLENALLNETAIVIVHRSLADRVRASGHPDTCVFSVAGIPLAMAALLKYFDHKSERFTQWGQHHPTAVVHARARIGSDVFLGPYCVIGAEASIGDGCLIGSHAVVENGAHIGARTILHPHVFVGAACTVGEDCEIHPHTSIGSDGFGYALGPDGRPRKIPHLGNVQIGDEVEIGSNCAIDRAKLTSTYIRSGAKLDNICHIAHNCDLGENGFYTAGFMMAGSTKIGRSFSTGGNSVVSAHLTLTDNVTLAGRSTVTSDITEPGQYGGFPLQPLREALKTMATIGYLNEIRKNLARVMKSLRAANAADADVVDAAVADAAARCASRRSRESPRPSHTRRPHTDR